MPSAITSSFRQKTRSFYHNYLILSKLHLAASVHSQKQIKLDISLRLQLPSPKSSAFDTNRPSPINNGFFFQL
uniref:Uncharacterized protein n=1 Tax=Xenopus tropicalis TaxID=8364 RepID=A0A1B8YAA1_XENTR